MGLCENKSPQNQWFCAEKREHHLQQDVHVGSQLQLKWDQDIDELMISMVYGD